MTDTILLLIALNALCIGIAAAWYILANEADARRERREYRKLARSIGRLP